MKVLIFGVVLGVWRVWMKTSEDQHFYRFRSPLAPLHASDA